MCCFQSNPRCTESLDRERVKEYIRQTADIPDIKTVSFTGGEPFLTFQDLEEFIELASQSGKRVTTITNGFWARDYSIAFDKLSRLKALGLSHISLSHDNYHHEFVKSEYVKIVLEAAVQLEISTTLSMVVKKDEKVGHLIDSIGSGLYGPEIYVVPCLPAGGASIVFNDEDFHRTLSIEGLRCIYDGNIIVSYDGFIYPCCSQMILDTGLTVGSFERLSLSQALDKINNNSLLYLLRNEKFDFFIDIAINKLGMVLPEKVVNVCELCAILFTPENVPLFAPFIMDRIEELEKEQASKDEVRALLS
jgi:YydG family peptide modification radical SAM enzyme